jgi:cobalt/nickel transport system permease protein
MGGVLAAVLVGPAAGALAVTVVLVVQALLFADGGLSALGLNVVNIALVGSFAGYAVFAALKRLLGRAPSVVTLAAGLAAATSPVLAAVAFTIEYAMGGNDAVSVGSVAWAMIGVHALIGIGEGIITALAVGAVLAMRPDLVHGARGVDMAKARPATLATRAG